MRPLCFLQSLLLLVPLAASPATCLHYDVPEVALEGRITRGELQVVPGNDNEGLHSDSDYRWYIDTTTPICVSGNAHLGNISVEGARHIEIWPLTDTHVGRYDGHTVKITGHFMPTLIPHYHAYLIFALVSVDVLPGKAP